MTNYPDSQCEGWQVCGRINVSNEFEDEEADGNFFMEDDEQDDDEDEEEN
jgi:hypothetical protein